MHRLEDGLDFRIEETGSATLVETTDMAIIVCIGYIEQLIRRHGDTHIFNIHEILYGTMPIT